MRAFRFFDSFRGGDARPWLLGIVRNACFTWLGERGRDPLPFDEMRDSGEPDCDPESTHPSPQHLLERKLERAQVNAAIATLPPLFREVLILRELEELSYEAIAEVAGIPVGTVMSRLSRARAMLRAALAATGKEN